VTTPTTFPRSPEPILGIIAGSGRYPVLLAEAARAAGKRLVVAAFEQETDAVMAGMADTIEWMRVGQLGKLIRFLSSHGVKEAIMAGQIAPGNLFNLRPDLKALLLLARLKERHAESIFGAIGDELAQAGITLLPATTHLEDCLPEPGHIGGPKPKARLLQDAAFGFRLAKEVSRLDIGQTVVVKHGTVLAVEAFEGTDEAIRRGGALGRGGATLVKVSKPHQDLRFDVPVMGTRTLETAAAAGIAAIVCEAKKTLLLDRPALIHLASAKRISLVALEEPPSPATRSPEARPAARPSLFL
jgi:UDP-2,3-diacylglucosamine hydrolase